MQRFCSLHSDLATPHKETLYSSQQGEGICVGVCRHAAKEWAEHWQLKYTAVIERVSWGMWSLPFACQSVCQQEKLQNWILWNLKKYMEHGQNWTFKIRHKSGLSCLKITKIRELALVEHELERALSIWLCVAFLNAASNSSGAPVTSLQVLVFNFLSGKFC